MNIHNISFSYAYRKTMKFEHCYEEDLQVDSTTRQEIINNGLVIYMHSSQGLIGESYGASPYELTTLVGNDEEEGVDCDPRDDESIYVYSTTVLPDFRGKGYGKLLAEEFSKHVIDNGYVKILGHATTPAMKKIREGQGAIFHPKGVHKNWFGTERTAHFYTQFLVQNKDYNCGPVALAYLLETKGFSYLVEYLEMELLTDKDTGTDPKNIYAFLEKEKIPYSILSELQPDSVIDMFDEDDGHWIVLIDEQDGFWRVYDPLVGLTIRTREELNNLWYSKRYGKGKGFHIL